MLRTLIVMIFLLSGSAAPASDQTSAATAEANIGDGVEGCGAGTSPPGVFRPGGYLSMSKGESKVVISRAGQNHLYFFSRPTYDPTTNEHGYLQLKAKYADGSERTTGEIHPSGSALIGAMELDAVRGRYGNQNAGMNTDFGPVNRWSGTVKFPWTIISPSPGPVTILDIPDKAFIRVQLCDVTPRDDGDPQSVAKFETEVRADGVPRKMKGYFTIDLYAKEVSVKLVAFPPKPGAPPSEDAISARGFALYGSAELLAPDSLENPTRSDNSPLSDP